MYALETIKKGEIITYHNGIGYKSKVDRPYNEPRLTQLENFIENLPKNEEFPIFSILKNPFLSNPGKPSSHNLKSKSPHDIAKNINQIKYVIETPCVIAHFLDKIDPIDCIITVKFLKKTGEYNDINPILLKNHKYFCQMLHFAKKYPDLVAEIKEKNQKISFLELITKTYKKLTLKAKQKKASPSENETQTLEEFLEQIDKDDGFFKMD